jgi:hypothetical protein
VGFTFLTLRVMTYTRPIKILGLGGKNMYNKLVVFLCIGIFSSVAFCDDGSSAVLKFNCLGRKVWLNTSTLRMRIDWQPNDEGYASKRSTSAWSSFTLPLTRGCPYGDYSLYIHTDSKEQPSLCNWPCQRVE